MSSSQDKLRKRKIHYDPCSFTVTVINYSVKIMFLLLKREVCWAVLSTRVKVSLHTLLRSSLFLSPRTTKLNPLLPSCVLMNYKFLTQRLSFLSITVQLCKLITLEHYSIKPRPTEIPELLRDTEKGLLSIKILC